MRCRNRCGFVCYTTSISSSNTCSDWKFLLRLCSRHEACILLRLLSEYIIAFFHYNAQMGCYLVARRLRRSSGSKLKSMLLSTTSGSRSFRAIAVKSKPKPKCLHLLEPNLLPQIRQISLMRTNTLSPRRKMLSSTPLSVCSSQILGRRYIHPYGPMKALPVPEGKFDILFFGGDSFSCHTLRTLYEAKGSWQNYLTLPSRLFNSYNHRYIIPMGWDD